MRSLGIEASGLLPAWPAPFLHTDTSRPAIRCAIDSLHVGERVQSPIRVLVDRRWLRGCADEYVRRSCLRLMLFTINLGHAQPLGKTTVAGVFTEAQAKRGTAAYDKNCASCHGTDLVSTDREVSNLTGNAFKRWNGKTVGELFEVTRDTMPPEEKRSLDDQVYLDIVAYILQFNKVPSGNQELKPDIESLKQIVIAPPQ
jgi:mono/diheme cytochrome c family protein